MGTTMRHLLMREYDMLLVEVICLAVGHAALGFIIGLAFLID